MNEGENKTEKQDQGRSIQRMKMKKVNRIRTECGGEDRTVSYQNKKILTVTESGFCC